MQECTHKRALWPGSSTGKLIARLYSCLQMKGTLQCVSAASEQTVWGTVQGNRLPTSLQSNTKQKPRADGGIKTGPLSVLQDVLKLYIMCTTVCLLQCKHIPNKTQSSYIKTVLVYKQFLYSLWGQNTLELFLSVCGVQVHLHTKPGLYQIISGEPET